MKNSIKLFIIAVSVIFASCEKETDLAVQQENLDAKSAQIISDEISVDNALADVGFESDFIIGAERMFAGMQNKGMHWGWNNSLRYQMGQCPEFFLEQDEAGLLTGMRMNYGNGIHLNNGRTVSGSINISMTQNPDGDGFIREITYEDFSINSITITGVTTITFTGENPHDGTHTVIQDLIITLADGRIVHREAEMVREWIAGTDTDLEQTDDILQITGYAVNTINDNGTETVYRKDITLPLIKSADCRYFSEGTVELSVDGSVLMTLDYGDGTCDDIAVVTKAGEEPQEIVLSEHDRGLGNQENKMNHQNGQGNQMHQGNNDAGNGQGNRMGNGGNGQGNGMGGR